MRLCTAFSLIAATILLAASSLQAVVVQMDSNFIAFNAEIGTLNDDSSNGAKFDVMAPAVTDNSFGDYLVMQSAGGSVSFDVQFMDAEVYTVYARYRETVNNTPTFRLQFGTTVTDSQLFTASSNQFAWVHLHNLNLTPNAGGSTETVTITALTGSDFAIDSFAIVKGSALTRTENRLVVSDATIPEAAFAVPEPSSVLLLGIGFSGLLMARRRPQTA